jgi:hemerythrin-like domain-containing protein
MFTQIGGKPESDFTEPLGMLTDCHKRIQYFLKVLVALAEHAAKGPLNENQRVDLEKALWYFREAGPRHTSDEEESLFPRLRAIDTPEVRRAFAVIDALEADHQQAEKSHHEIDVLGHRWLSEGALPEDEAVRFITLLTDLSRLYERHLPVEETEIFALAESVLSRSEKELVGQEMAKRRGILRRSGGTGLGGA